MTSPGSIRAASRRASSYGREGWCTAWGFSSTGKLPNPNARGEPVTDDSFYLIFNAHFEDLDFILPPNRWGMRWLKVFDTAEGWSEDGAALEAGATLSVVQRSFVLLQRQAS